MLPFGFQLIYSGFLEMRARLILGRMSYLDLDFKSLRRQEFKTKDFWTRSNGLVGQVSNDEL